MAREDELSAFPMEKIGKYILIFRTFRYKRPIVGYKNGGGESRMQRRDTSGGEKGKNFIKFPRHRNFLYPAGTWRHRKYGAPLR